MINKNELEYQIILSKGKGTLTKQAFKLLKELVDNYLVKFISSNKYENYKDIKQDVYLHLLTNWKTYNEVKYNNAFAYFTELSKRAVSASYNHLNQIKYNYRTQWISISNLNNLI